MMPMQQFNLWLIMAEYNYSELIKKLNAFVAVIDELNALAEKELWDDLLLQWSRYDAQTANLPQIDWREFPAQDQETLAQTMRQLDASNTRLMTLTQTWRNELQDILQSTVQSRKLNDHYR